MKPDRGTLRQIRRWVIGGDPDCNLVVDDSRVSGQHCLLVEAEDGFLLEDLGSTNGTFVNGIRIDGRVKVTRMDAITLGQSAPMPWPKQDNASFVRVISVGREPDNDVELDYPMISGHHARILIADGKAVIEDLGSMNGTAVGRPENKIKRSPITKDDTVFFGSFRIPASRLLPGKLTMGRTPQSELSFKGREMTLGRDPDCDHPLDYPMISWRHARLSRGGGAMIVEDLGSTNGIFVNGRRIIGPVTVSPGDVISLGSYTFRLTSDGIFEKRDYRGNLTIEARNLTVEAPGKRLLEDVSLTIYPSELVGLMGPSGAGKTTLMMALNGYAAPTRGATFFNGEDLYRNYAQFRGHIGYVPQDDIMHRDLTVGQALYYTARLRLPKDYSDADIRKRIEEVMNQLGLQGLENVRVGSPEKKGVSGGQRKRVNLAMELLTDPAILFLDEPTSGLSSEDALMVMKVLKRLADAGKTILITIHQPSLEVFRLMDSLVVIGKDEGSPQPGRLVFFGPAYPDSIDFFNPGGAAEMKSGVEPAPDEALKGLKKIGADECARRYANSEYKREYVDGRQGQRPSDSARPMAPKVKRQIGIGQWWTLLRRNFNIKLSDRAGTAILLLQAPIIALLVVMAFGRQTNKEVAGDPEVFLEVGAAMSKAVFVMTLAALWFGCSNAAREIVGEWAIYHRERMVNLKIPSYVAAKFATLGSLCVIQCVMMLGIAHWGCGLKGEWTAMYGALLLTAFNGIALGLLASAVAKTSEMAIALVPLILLPMIIAGGALTPRSQMIWPDAAQVLPSRWAFEAALLLEAGERELMPAPKPPPGKPSGAQNAAARIDMADTHFPAEDNKNIRKDRSGVGTSVIMLGAIFFSLALAILITLKLRDVHR